MGWPVLIVSYIGLKKGVIYMQKIWAKYFAILAGLGLMIGIYLTLKPCQTAPVRIPAVRGASGYFTWLGRRYIGICVTKHGWIGNGSLAGPNLIL